ncbi:hypothetical protein TNCV_892451 [Trichonephila clavipes]|nr:hypothetical protein TNCV_892451 [Trichonephila clavipes]
MVRTLAGLKLTSLKELSRWLQEASPGHRINSKQKVLSSERWTSTLQFARGLSAVPGSRTLRQKLYSRFAETGLYPQILVWCIPLTASISPPTEDKYITLKSALLSRLTDSEEEKLKMFLGDLELGDRCPFDLLC